MDGLPRPRRCTHYSGWMARLGPDAITRLADSIGVGVYFNPFVEWRDKVGAGLPVIASVTHIIASGDPVCLLWFSHIVGSLSGTLGYVMSELEDGKRFSEVMKTARSLGYTEPGQKKNFIHLWHYKINVYSVFIRYLSLQLS
uniref:Homoserine dehydrogenase catalytic domain-containing protein n=1 Tax=Oryza glumipatula TaxID=40148 RepID=A0A0D9ZWV8_9ORYZ